MSVLPVSKFVCVCVYDMGFAFYLLLMDVIFDSYVNIYIFCFKIICIEHRLTLKKTGPKGNINRLHLQHLSKPH